MADVPVGLEVNESNLPEVYPRNDEQHKYLNRASHQHEQTFAQNSTAQETSIRDGIICGLRKTTFVLVMALMLAILLGISGAAVGGSIATKRRTVTSQPNQSSSPPTANTPTSTGAENTTSLGALSATASSGAINTTALLATSDCERLGKTYTSAQTPFNNYTIHCASNIDGHNILGVFVYFFEDCIEACASNNRLNKATCNAIAYAIDFDRNKIGGYRGNCFLKDKPYGARLESSRRGNVSSVALLARSG